MCSGEESGPHGRPWMLYHLLLQIVSSTGSEAAESENCVFEAVFDPQLLVVKVLSQQIMIPEYVLWLMMMKETNCLILKS